MKQFLTLLLTAVLLLSCIAQKPSVEDDSDEYYVVMDPAILGIIYEGVDLDWHMSEPLGYDSMEVQVSRIVDYPLYIRFDKDSITYFTHLFSPGGDIEARGNNHYAYYYAQRYCRSHNICPAIQLSYRINKNSGLLELERPEWPMQRHGRYKYTFEKITPEEIVVRYYLGIAGMEKYFNRVTYRPGMNGLPENRPVFCCFDSVECYIHKLIKEEGILPYDSALLHDHNVPNIDTLTYDEKLKQSFEGVGEYRRPAPWR